MALFVRQDEKRSQLQEKLAADLKGKLQSSDSVQLEKLESALLENAHQTRPAGMIIMVLLILVCIIAVATMFVLS